MPSHYQRIVTDPAKIHDPDGAYAHGIKVGETLYVAGQVAMNTEGQIVHANDPQGQFRLIIKNITTNRTRRSRPTCSSRRRSAGASRSSEGRWSRHRSTSESPTRTSASRG